jgi:large subunit ribosomal protein L21
MYVVFQAPGRQLKAEVGQQLRVDFLTNAKEGDKVAFDKVLLVADGQNVRIGTPYVAAKIHATVVGHMRSRKLIIFKKHKRVDYHKKQGHRQCFTTVKIDSIEA